MAVEMILRAINLPPGTIERSVRHVLIELASFANGKETPEKNTCFPGIETLAKRTGYAEGTVTKAIKTLVEKGYVVKKRRFNSSNFYTISIPKTKNNMCETLFRT